MVDLSTCRLVTRGEKKPFPARLLQQQQTSPQRPTRKKYGQCGNAQKKAGEESGGTGSEPAGTENNQSNQNEYQWRYPSESRP
jgi:hypothetical protein